jgi:accessory colonization factor AcfC
MSDETPLIARSALVPALPLKDAAALYAEQTGVHIEVKAGRPEKWMPQVREGATVDLLCCGAEFLLDLAEVEGLVAPGSRLSLGLRRAALIVPSGNPGGVDGLASLGRAGVRVGIGVEGCTLGLWDELAGRAGNTAAVLDNIVLRSPGCGALLGAVARGEVDAGIGWENFDCHPSFDVDVVTLPPEHQVWRSTGIGVSTSSDRPDLAHAFVQWLRTDPAREIYRSWGWILEPR